MKVSIGQRLFGAALLSFIVVAGLGVELVRWKLIDNFAPHAPNTEIDRLGGLAAMLSAQYGERHDWSFLPADAALRQAWLRDALQRLPAVEPSTPMLGYRVGLLGLDKRCLAGVQASRLLVVLASIDQIERPLAVEGHTIGYLVVAASPNPDDALAVAFLLDQQRNLAVIAAVGVLLSALAAAALAASFRRPITRLVEGARELGHGRYSMRLNLPRRDELGELASTFNQLAAKLDDAERSRRQWVADTSHELRTPLAVLRGQIEALQDGIRSATPEHVALMLRQVLSLSKRIDDLYELARADIAPMRLDRAAADVWRLVEETVDAYAEKTRAAELTVALVAGAARPLVRIDAERMRQVLANLLENSVRYTAAGGRIEIDGRIVGSQWQLTIDDSAPGVPGSALERLGERFFRVEASRSREFGGAGLGLALVRQIVEAHGGLLAFEPSPLGGLRVTLSLELEG